MESISHHITPLVVNGLGGGHTHTHTHAHTHTYTHTHTHTHTCEHTDNPHRFNFKKPGTLACLKRDSESFTDGNERFEMVAEACHWDECITLVNLVTRLRGQAYSFYRSCDGSQCMLIIIVDLLIIIFI